MLVRAAGEVSLSLNAFSAKFLFISSAELRRSAAAWSQGPCRVTAASNTTALDSGVTGLLWSRWFKFQQNYLCPFELILELVHLGSNNPM